MDPISIALGVAFPTLFFTGLGLALGSVSHTAFWIAKASFCLAALDLAVLLVWGLYATEPAAWKTIVAAAFGLIMIAGLPQLLTWVDGNEIEAARIKTVRTAFSATESIKLWPTFLGGNETLNLDNIAVLRVLVPLNNQITLALNTVPIRMRDVETPGLKIQGMQLQIQGEAPEYLFDRDKNKRHEISVEGRTFIVLLQDIYPRTVQGVANPIEYVFGISEK